MDSDTVSTSSTPEDMVVQRLLARGVPTNYLDAKQMGLVQFVNENKGMLQDVVGALFPGVEEAQLQGLGEEKRLWNEYKQGHREGIKWAQWLMFAGDPEENLKCIRQEVGQARGVCGEVWGSKDIAYKCRTCENDPTCAICVACFEAGNHVNHDYSMIHTGGGCCDCGDVTAWKETGFCSNHRGPGQAPPLPVKLVSTFKPVMDALLVEWANRLRAAAEVSDKRAKNWSDQLAEERVAMQTSLAFVELLLNFCNCSESLLNFIGSLTASEDIGLLDVLLKSECFLQMKVRNMLHELLFKLMGDPNFKYQFSKVFIRHYPQFILDSLKEEIEPSRRGRSRDSLTLSSFSVQIFTVPTLTPQLVVDLRLLDMLLEVLKDVLLSCAGDDGRLLVSKGPLASNSYSRIVDDIRFVLRHPEVTQYVARERLDLYKAWLHLLAYIQGMDSQRRQTNIHIEEETESWFTAYLVEVQMASIHSLLIEGASKTACKTAMDEKMAHQMTDISCRENPKGEDIDHGHAKIGRISKDSDVSGKVETSGSFKGNSDRRTRVDVSTSGKVSFQTSDVPSALLLLIAECARILEVWLLLDAYRTTKVDWPTLQNHRRTPALRRRGGRGIIRESLTPSDDTLLEGLNADMNLIQGPTFIEWLRTNRHTEINFEQEVTCERSDAGWDRFQEWKADSEIWLMGSDFLGSDARFGFVWNDKEWLDISFDVSQQDISLHIPLHRFLALALQKTTETCLNFDQQESTKRSWHSNMYFATERELLQQLLPPHYRTPSFASLLMEHPLRIQVFCAQNRAGMWRRNGHYVQSLFDYYYSVRWCEDSSDLDLYLLQFCAVMAPPEDFVDRIVTRFGLVDYFSLFLLRPNEYETILAQHMLSLLIQIVAERGFCGSTSAQTCRRELIRRLAISDATHSQLMKSLPPRLHDNKQWQEVLQAVSAYSKPSGMQQGKYSLRDECWKELDLHHPRWNAKELQSAEDRYLCSCKASAVIKQLPQWKKPFSPFEDLSRIATCRKVHDILRSILFHAVFSKKISESRAPEGVLITALHLLSLGLDICPSFSYDKSFDCKYSGLKSDSSMEFSPYEPPPLLSKATEKVHFGGADSGGISNRQSLISLLVLLMEKYSPEACGGAKESHLCNIGVLIRNLLKQFADLHHGCMYEVESLAPEILHRISSIQDSSTKEQTSSVTEAERRKLLARERQAAIMEKMKAAQEKFASSLQSTQEGHSMEKGHPVAACALCRDSSSDSPLCLLTFVQRSRLLAIAAKGIPSLETGHVKENYELSVNSETGGFREVQDSTSDESQIRAELLNLIQMALNGEVDQTVTIGVESLWEFLADEGYADVFENRLSSLDPRSSEASSAESESDDLIDEEKDDSTSDSAYPGIALGCLQSAGGEMAIDEDGNDKLVQSSIINILIEYVSTISRNRRKRQMVEAENSAGAMSQGQQRHRYSRISHAWQGVLPENLGSNDNVGVHMSSCGHAVHKECLDLYLSSLMQRYQSRTLYEGLQIVDPEQGEFLCPVCRRLANSVLPYIPESMSIPSYAFPDESVSGNQTRSMDDDMIDITPKSLVAVSGISHVIHAITLLHNAEELVWKAGFRKAISKPLPKTVKAVFDGLFLRLCGLYFPGRDVTTKSNYCRVSQSLLLWDVLRYTIMSAELASRTGKENRIYALSKTALNEPVLPLLVWAAKIIRSQNRQSVLLRSRGMQLLVGSISFGGSRDSLSEPLIPGSISRMILSRLDSGSEAADVQFWKRMADPVLAHDPFSSLVWTFFCLPSFPSSVEPVIALVHLFYLVCLIQAIDFMGETILSNLSGLQLSSSTCNFLQIVVSDFSKTSIFRKCDDQTPHSSSESVIATIRRFTLPYLRCCALFEHLFFASCLERTDVNPNIDAAAATRKVVGWINPTNNDINDSLEDLKELEVLEGQFSILPLQQILESEHNQKLILRWCQHLMKESGSRKLCPIPRPVTAAPFKLMDLPPLYQTLLQRYIKERCPKCSIVPEQPALCLLCGTLFCGLSRNGCRSTNGQSECYKHAMVCGGGVGVFLMIRKTNILLQRCARQASWPSPYLDGFGEEDIDMYRGKPLYLNEERYDSLAALVVTHGLDHNSFVLSHTTREAIMWRLIRQR